MTLRITLTDDERAVLQAVADGRPLGKSGAGGSTVVPDGLPLDVARLAPRHRIVRDRARLLVLLDASHKLYEACRAVGRSHGWATSVYHAYRQGGLEAVLAPHEYERRTAAAAASAAASADPLAAHPPTAAPAETRDAQVAALCRQGLTLRAIAGRLGLSAQRVGQIKARAAREGHDVTPSAPLYTFEQAATELGVCAPTLTNLARDLWPGDPVRCPRRGARGAAHTGQTRLAGGKRLRAEDVETLRSAVNLLAGRCSVCGTQLSLPSRGGRPKACPEHRKEQQRRARSTVRHRKPTPANTTPGRTPQLALTVLADVPPDPDGGHCLVHEAARVSGLSLMKIHWLGERGILATTPDPGGSVHRVTGRPVRVYFRNQLEALARAGVSGGPSPTSVP